ncbi:amidase [Microbacteriaceae bacterium 4G12]
MHLHEYASRDATGLRKLLATGEVTAAEVEAAARSAIDGVNGDLNALARPLFDPALTADPRGSLAGVPFLIKDSGPFARGVPFALGSRAIRGAVATADHDLMTRFRSAGLVALGQTTAPELGFSFVTEPLRTGPTCNPWDLARGVGGSSGGSAALVAAGAVPVAHGNDGAGSLRVPASACGVVGLKPGRGRTPSGPLAGEAGFGLTIEFGLTRTVRDAAALLDAVGAPPVGDKYVAAAPNRPYRDAIRTDPGRLRVALMHAAWSGAAVDPQVVAATVRAAETLEWIGHTVVEAAPRFEAEDVVEAQMLNVYATGGAMLRAPRQPDPALLEAVSRQVLREVAAARALDVLAAVEAQNRVTRPIGMFLDEHDLLVTPTLGRLPLPHGSLDQDTEGLGARDWLRRILEVGPFTAPFNVSGHPAISLPLAQSREGLPIGVQLVAAAGREDLLLQVAAQLEEALPWRNRQPPVFAG